MVIRYWARCVLILASCLQSRAQNLQISRPASDQTGWSFARITWKTQPAPSPGAALASAVDAGAVTVTVSAPGGFSPPPFLIRIDAEELEVTAVSGAAWTVVRGWESTPPAAHAAGSAVLEATSDTVVCYGADAQYGSSAQYYPLKLQSASKSVRLDGLIPATVYHYKVCSTPVSQGASSCTAASPATACSEDRTFKTEAVPHVEVSVKVALPAGPLPAQRAAAPAVKAAKPLPPPATPTLPDPAAGAPPAELAAHALLEAASGNLNAALGRFTATNFPAAKIDSGVRHAYIEIQLQRLRDLAGKRQCHDALDGVYSIGKEDAAIPFTLHGFDELMKGARFQYYLGAVEALCGDSSAARRRWTKVAKLTPEPATVDFVFPALAAQSLSAAAGKSKIAAATAAVERLLSGSEDRARGALLFSRGVLLAAAGQDGAAIEAFEQGAAAPNEGISQYVNSLALRESRGAK